MTTDNPTVDGDGAGGTPTPQVSTPAIEDANTLARRLDEISANQNRLAKELGGLQRRQDVAENSQRAFLEEYERQKATGKSSAEAESAATQVINERSAGQKRDAAIDLLLRKEGLLPNQPVGNGAGGTVDVAEVVRSFKLDKDDPKVVALLANRQFKSAEEVEVVMARFVREQATNLTPSEGDRAANPAPPPGGERSTADLLADWDKVKQYPDSKEYKAVKAALDKKGWQ